MMDSLLQGQHSTHSPEDGIWIGVDFGTSNSSCAVWDSANGRAKWIRLPTPTLAPPSKFHKKGRIMPSTILFGTGQSVYDILEKTQTAIVGQAAVKIMLQESLQETTSTFNQQHHSFDQVSRSFLSSVKRIFGMKPAQLKQQKHLLKSLPFQVVFQQNESGNEEEVLIRVEPLNNNNNKTTPPLFVTPLQVTAIILSRLRQACQVYLDTEGRKKKLDIPGKGNVRNVVVSVPAHYSRHQRKLMEQACRLAGFSGEISTISESTAASMAYGLFASCFSPKNILVFDMGGGTTDVTLCRQDVDSTFCVIVTHGNEWLGGDDMDQALLELVWKKCRKQPHYVDDDCLQERQRLLQSCRKAKQDFCGHDDNAPVDSVTIVIDDKTRVDIFKNEFHVAMEPIIQQAQEVVQSALKRLASFNNNDCVDEVVLVGGATRVPQVRTMLQNLFPTVELCTSINADSAVAQGAAIQAALVSSLVPPHELRSALMLDALPHAIGVQLPNDEFLCILEKDSQLPSKGIATFTLACKTQPGVTVVAVEKVGDDDFALERIGEFTFLLQRLSDEQLSSLDTRSVDIGMSMNTNGNFIVSIFDPLDPEHQAKKRRYEELQNKAKTTNDGKEATLDYNNEVVAKSVNVGVLWTRQEVQMMILPILLFCLYVAVKLAFHEPLVQQE